MNNFSMDELGGVFTETLREVISTVSGFSLDILPGEYDPVFNDIVGIMNLNNDRCAMMVFVSAQEADMRVLCSYMTGVPEPEVSKEDIEDALCEFANMTAGNVKLRLNTAESVFNLTMPFVIRGENMSVNIKRKLHVFSRTLSNDRVSVKLKVIY